MHASSVLERATGTTSGGAHPTPTDPPSLIPVVVVLIAFTALGILLALCGAS